MGLRLMTQRDSDTRPPFRTDRQGDNRSTDSFNRNADSRTGRCAAFFRRATPKAESHEMRPVPAFPLEAVFQHDLVVRQLARLGPRSFRPLPDRDHKTNHMVLG